MASGVTENEIAEAVLKILSGVPSGEATLSYLKIRIPSHVKLTAADVARSLTRPREPVWEQRLRNIKSHHDIEGNFIYEGYLTAPSRGRLRITSAGRTKIGAI
jgi:hypothetical protein